MTTEISVMYGSEKVNTSSLNVLFLQVILILASMAELDDNE